MNSTAKEKIAPKISAIHTRAFVFVLRKFKNKREYNGVKIIP
jgi:hypothetical protein